MDRLIAPNTVVSGAADVAPGSGTPGYATEGNPATSTPATVFAAYQYNAIQEELMAIIAAGGLTADRTNNAQVLAAIRALIGGGTGRLRLVSNTTFYVNPATGSDSNNGLTTGTAWLTRQHAVDYISNNVDINGFTCGIQFADGTYTDSLAIVTPFLGGTVNLIGNLATPANCIISPASANCLFVGCPSLVTIGGFKVTPTGSQVGVEAQRGAVVNITGAMEYAGSGLSHIDAQAAATIFVGAGYKISGGGNQHISGQSLGQIRYTASMTVTLAGTPAFTVFADANDNGLVACNSGLVTFAGSGATGSRYAANSNGMIDTQGGGANFFPGSSAGSSVRSDQYV